MKPALIIPLLFVLSCLTLSAKTIVPQYSTAGYFAINGSPRQVFNMNVAWRFFKGTPSNDATLSKYDDSAWEVVSVPHGLEYLPVEASGCVNFQGEVWYRKHFQLNESEKLPKSFLYFEAIMGKCKIWLNGKLLKEHFGGFLPIVVDASSVLNYGKDNVLVVCADNSDDIAYPPGRAQKALDFAYFGGIYRDVYLIKHNSVYITDPNYVDEVAGGGLYVSTNKISDENATISVKLHLNNEEKTSFTGKINYTLIDASNKVISKFSEITKLNPLTANHFSTSTTIKNPKLWSPQSPYLYWLKAEVLDAKGKLIDSYKKRIGIRSIEFKGNEGFFLNGKRYPKPLIGVNRHQDFAIIGNALSNSLHWRDAFKLRSAGIDVIRNAHYPQDPAFMDACDELGMFVIETTPGWQFWNKNPNFEKRVYEDIRNISRRDRDRPSFLFWEPILNETDYPDSFADKAQNAVKEEFPFNLAYTACDNIANGNKLFPIQYAHPANDVVKNSDNKISFFTREFGDYVDNWASHNSPSRVSRAWGEQAMLIQSIHYLQPDYKQTSIKSFYEAYPQVFGGCLWHSFDHQRGYHPDPFYGGIMDAFRQPKYSYYMFASQRDPIVNPSIEALSGPMIFIAHEMTPFSSKDVQVYTNCDEVILTGYSGKKVETFKRPAPVKGDVPSPIITFKNFFDFVIDKTDYEMRPNELFIEAQGLINGKVVATQRIAPARSPSKIVLSIDNDSIDLIADGSDMVTVIASITDEKGNVKHLNNSYIKFSVEGEASLVGENTETNNPRRLEWGSAPILIRSTTKPGDIVIKASMLFDGAQRPISGEIKLRSVAPSIIQVFNEKEYKKKTKDAPYTSDNQQLEQKLQNRDLIQKVMQQQKYFGE